MTETDETKEPGVLAAEMLKKRLDEAVSHNNTLKKENGELKSKLSLCLTPEQTNRLKNDNKRLLGLTERINTQRGNLEEKFKEKKKQVEEAEREISTNKEELALVIADRNKLKEMVENLLKEIDKYREEIKMLKDGKSFADFVELKRQIKELKDENNVLSQGLQSDHKGSLKFNLNDLATMLRLKQGDTIDTLSQRNQTQRVVVLDERELEESIRKGDHLNSTLDNNRACSRDSPPEPANHRPLTSRNSVNRINFISPPRSLNTSPRVYSRQNSRERWSSPAEWGLPGTKTTGSNIAHPMTARTGKEARTVVNSKQTHFIVRRRSSPRWPSLGELKERYQSGNLKGSEIEQGLQGAWTAKPSIEEVSEYIKKRQSSGDS